MKLTKLSITLLTFTAAILLIAGMLFRGAAQTTPSDQSSSITSGDSTQVKIARAMSAGPEDYSNNPERKSKNHEAREKSCTDHGRKQRHRLGDGETVCERRRVCFHYRAP